MAFLSRIGKWSLQRKSFNIQDKTKVSKKAVPQHQLILSSRLDVLCRRPISEASCLYWATSSTGRQDQISDNSQERLLIFIFGFYYIHQILQPSLFVLRYQVVPACAQYRLITPNNGRRPLMSIKALHHLSRCTCS